MIATILKIIRFSDFSTYKRLIILQVLSFSCESITQGEYI